VIRCSAMTEPHRSNAELAETADAGMLRVEVAVEPRDEVRRAVREQVSCLDPSVRTVRVGDGAVEVELDPEVVRVAGDRLAGAVRDVVERARKSFRRAREQVLFRIGTPPPTLVDPVPALLARGDLRPHGAGRWTWAGPAGTLIDRLDACFARLAREIGAETVVHPSTVRLDSLARAGWLESFPHNALMVSAVRRAADAIAAIEAAGASGDGCGCAAALEDPVEVLAPTVCYRLFEALADGPAPEGLRTFTAVACCHRRELDVHPADLARLQCFHMREIVFMGPGAKVESMRHDLLDALRGILEGWDLAATVSTANDPFFGRAADGKRGYQMLQRLKIEVRLAVPPVAGRDEDDPIRWVAAASFNHHQRSLLDGFAIAAPEDAASGCVEFGLERLALAVLSRHGIEPEGWPEDLRP